MLTVSNLSVSFNKKNVLSDISLEINQGEIVAIVGESGSGKTTLMKHLYSLIPDTISWCPQESGLVAPLSVFHNIYAGTLNEHSFLYNLRNLISPKKSELAKVIDISSRLNIEQYVRNSVDQLSGGQQQRVNIARALIQQNDIFLGDEAVSALDDFHKIQVIKTITKAFSTCVFALHDLDLALTCCDRIIGLKQGKVVFDEKVGDVTKSQLSLIYSYHSKYEKNSLNA